jgi:hypothetical protein
VIRQTLYARTKAVCEAMFADIAVAHPIRARYDITDGIRHSLQWAAIRDETLPPYVRAGAGAAHVPDDGA